MTCFIARAAGLIFDFAFSKANYWRGPRGSSEGSTRMAAATRSVSRSSDPLRTLLSGLVVTSAAQVADAATLTVPSAKFPTIQSAIDFAANGDEVRVQIGAYAENLDSRGKAIAIRSVSGAALTILDSSGGTGCGVWVHSDTQASITIEGFTVSRAVNHGVNLQGGRADIRNCKFLDCGGGNGAGLYAKDGLISITDCVFQDCTATATAGTSQIGGGAIFADGCVCVIERCNFLRCSAVVGYPSDVSLVAQGGAIRMIGSSATIVASSFSECVASASDQGALCLFGGCGKETHTGWLDLDGRGGSVAQGGAVYIDEGSDLVIQNTSVSNCQARADTTRNQMQRPGYEGATTVKGYGGAIWIGSASAALVDGCSLSGCNAYSQLDVRSFGSACAHCNSGGECCVCWGAGYPESISTQVWWSGGGGGIALVGGTMTMRTTSISGGSVVGNAVTRGSADGRACFFNTASRPGLGGSLIYSERSSNVRIEDSALEAGGLEQVVLRDSVATISGTVARGGGISSCAIASEGSSPLIYKCVISGFTSAGISASGTGRPSIGSSLLCGNGSGGVLGAWADSGSNVFRDTCVNADCNHDGIDDAFQISIGEVQDCDGNGMPDTCDINDGRATDCDGDDVPDSCQFRPTTIASATLSPLQSGTTLIHTFSDVKATGGPVVATINAQGDLSSTLEYITMKANGVTLGKLWEVGGQDCAPLTTEFTIPTEQFNSILAGGSVLQFQFVPSAQVTPGQCATSYVKVTLEYQPKVPGDLDGSGMPDVCEAGRFDLDGNRVIDFGDIALLMLDFGPCTNCPDDFDQNGRIDFGDVALLMLEFGNLP